MTIEQQKLKIKQMVRAMLDEYKGTDMAQLLGIIKEKVERIINEEHNERRQN
jgi:hypothetical protein